MEESPLKDEPTDRVERVRTPPPVGMNNHDLANAMDAANVDPGFSDDETEASPAKIVRIEIEDDEVPERERLMPLYYLSRVLRLIFV